MRKLLLLGICVALIASAQQKKPAMSADEQQIRAIAEKFKDAYNRNDGTAAAALYAEDAYYVSQHVRGGILQGREAIKANIEKGAGGGGHIDSIEILTLGFDKKFAYTVGTYHATNHGEQVTGRNIVVLKKFGSKWLIVAHTSVVPEQP